MCECSSGQKQRKDGVTALSLEQVERFLTQLSDFATMNKISLGPLKNIVKSILLVPNGK